MLCVCVCVCVWGGGGGGGGMNREARKPVFRLSDQVRHKPGCTSTEDD